jgi:hypothetical protein
MRLPKKERRREMGKKFWHRFGGGVLVVAALVAAGCGDHVTSNSERLSAQSPVASGESQEHARTALAGRTAASQGPAETLIWEEATESKNPDSADDSGSGEEPTAGSTILPTPPEAGTEAASDSSDSQHSSSPEGDSLLAFRDARSQAADFIGYYKSINLTAEQKGIRADALLEIRAPCCDDYSLATCCCECNLAKSVWGLSSFLISQRNYDAEQVREAALEWIQFINPDGFSGTSCSTGGCKRPFAQDGCGGMNEARIF